MSGMFLRHSVHMHHLRTTNIGCGFYALQLGYIARLWHDFLSVSLSVGLSVTDVLWLSGAR